MLRIPVLVFALALTACASSSAPGSTSAPKAQSTVAAPTTPGCPNPEGGVCLGALEPGTYRTKSFAPGITYTVDSGWANLEDLPGNFLLERPGDPRYLGIYQNVRAPAECEESWAPGLGATVDDLLGWYTSHPGLVVSANESVNVGGLDGVFIDIALDPTWTVTCAYSEGMPVVPVFIGDGTSQVHHVMLPGFELRLYLLDWNGGNVLIEVGAEGTSLEAYLTEVIPIIELLEFDS